MVDHPALSRRPDARRQRCRLPCHDVVVCDLCRVEERHEPRKRRGGFFGTYDGTVTCPKCDAPVENELTTPLHAEENALAGMSESDVHAGVNSLCLAGALVPGDRCVERTVTFDMVERILDPDSKAHGGDSSTMVRLVFFACHNSAESESELAESELAESESDPTIGGGGFRLLSPAQFRRLLSTILRNKRSASSDPAPHRSLRMHSAVAGFISNHLETLEMTRKFVLWYMVKYEWLSPTTSVNVLAKRIAQFMQCVSEPRKNATHSIIADAVIGRMVDAYWWPTTRVATRTCVHLLIPSTDPGVIAHVGAERVRLIACDTSSYLL